ncbi:MAG: ribosome maturation factor RimM [Deltaproteobacteria bacterium]|nr:ribosome maturation factor RimM [Deltaproteobacteria bacterium]
MALIDRDRLTCIGVVLQPHGLKGELRVRQLTDAAHYYERKRPPVILETSRGLRPLAIREIRSSGRDWVLLLEGVTTREAAEALQGANVLLEQAHLKPLEEDEYFTDDLLGSQVITLAGETVGEVTGLLDIGPHEVLMVQGTRGEVLIPLVPHVVTTVDMGARVIHVDPPPGLLELNLPGSETGTAGALEREPEEAPEVEPGMLSGNPGSTRPPGRRRKRR